MKSSIRQTYAFVSLAMSLSLASVPHQAEQSIDWPAYGGAPGGGHFSTADEITPENVDGLTQAWTHRSGDYIGGVQSLTEAVSEEMQASRPTSFIGTPIMTEDTLFYCTPFNRVFALDPATGKERWAYDPQVDMSNEPLTNCRGVSSWKATSPKGDLCDHRIILGTLDSRLIAIDGVTGKVCPDFGNDGAIDLTEGLNAHEANEYGVTSAPAIIGDLIVTGAYVTDSIRSDIPAGVVRAYNVVTGDFVWGWNPVHPDQQQRNKQGEYVAGSTNVWSTISIDEELGLVIVPTGNSSPDYYGGDRTKQEDYYSSSVVALDAKSGEVVWHYQTVHHDIWDFDVPAQPTLVDVTIDGKTRPAVVQVTKMGMTFVLDRETGKPLHPVEERPVPQTGQVNGEYLSPTQPFPLLPEPLHQLSVGPEDAWGFTFWDEGACRELLEARTTGPIYTPPSTKGTIFYPSNLGGNNWGAPAVDLDNQIMIANTKHAPIEVKMVPQEDCPAGTGFPQKDSPFCAVMTPLLSPLGAPCTKPPWATLAAVNLNTGKILWQEPLGTLENFAPWPVTMFYDSGLEAGGPIVTKTGLIFIAATSDAYIRAIDIKDGAELWKEKLPATGNAVPMTYAYKGKQYVVIAAGGHFTSPLPSADFLIAYALPD